MRLTQDRQLSEDVVQEVLLKAWKDPGLGQRDDGAARAWLFTASRNLIIDRWRSAAIAARAADRGAARRARSATRPAWCWTAG